MSATDPNAHISTAEIERDIVDTEAEIVTMQQELVAWNALPYGSPDYMLAHKLRIPAAQNGIKQRLDFIEMLRDILRARKVIA